MRYEIQGRGEPVVLIGGFGILHEQFHLVTPLLAQHFTVLNWNWRGAGHSDRTQTRDYSIEGWTEDLRTVLDAAGIARAAVWATSTGSLVGIHFAARYPERVRTLITYPYFKTDPELRRVYQCYQHIFDVFGWDGITRILSWIGMPEERVAFAGGYRVCLVGTAVSGAQPESQCVQQNVSGLRVCGFDGRFAAAVLSAGVGTAGKDGPLGLETQMICRLAEEFRAAVPRAQTQMIAGAGGTYCMLEKPQETAQRVSKKATCVPSGAP